MTAEFTEAQRRFLESHRVGHLATADAEGRPHTMPVCYALDGHDLLSPIDEKPKRVAPSKLRRIRNIQENPQVALVVDEYSEDWVQLGYLLVRGRAEIVTNGPVHAKGLRLLRERYEQYRSMALEDKPLLRIVPERIVAWGKVE